jgi:sRNA-binding carbon storage regulator CsrA
MEFNFDPSNTTALKVQPDKIDTYVIFREFIPKPPHEEEHLRHILRFYIARAMLKQEINEIFILPEFQMKGNTLQVDLLGIKEGKVTLAICEPESITLETEELLEQLKELDGVDIVVVHSQYGKPGNVESKFAQEIDSGKIRILAVVPPPFDDTYEYDIWMFDLTFRDLFADN